MGRGQRESILKYQVLDNVCFTISKSIEETHLCIRGECCKDDIKDPEQQTHCRRLV